MLGLGMEKIGLKAVMEDANFIGGMTRYLTGINTMNVQTGLASGGMSGALVAVGGAVLKLGTILAGAGVAAVGAFSAAMATGLVASTKAAISVESAYAGVIKTTDGLTDAEGRLNETGTALKQDFLDLSEVIPLTAEELMRIGELGGQLGIPKDALLDFTEVVAALGVSTNLYNEEAATALARIANIMGTAQGDYERMGSSIVDLGNNFATTEQEIVNFGLRIAGAGKIAGLSEAEIFAIGAAMSSVGVQAEAGGTAVQKVLIAMNSAAVLSSGGIVDNTSALGKNASELEKLQQKLAIAQQQQAEFTERTKESTRMAKAAQIDQLTQQIAALNSETEALNETQGMLITADTMGQFANVAGMAAEEFRQLWEEDAGEAFTRFVEGLGEAGDEAISFLTELDLTDQRLVRSFLSLSNAGDLLRRAMGLSESAWEENIALQEEADKRYRTTESQLTMLKNTFRNLGITLGSEVLPFLNELVLAARPVLKEIAGQLPALIEGTLKPALESVLETGGEFLLWLGTNLPQIIATTVPLLQGLIQGFLSLAVWLGTNLPPAVATAQGLFASIGEIIATVQGHVSAFVTAATPIIENFIGTLGRIGEALEGPLARAGELIEAVLADVIPWAREQLGGILIFLMETFRQAAVWFEENKEVISNTLISLRQIWDAVWPYLQAVLETAIANFKLAVRTGMAVVQGVIEAVMLAIQGDWSGAWEALKGALGAALDGFLQAVGNTLDLILGFFGTSLGTLWTEIVAWGANTLTSFLEWGQGVVDMFVNLKNDALAFLRAWFGSMGLDLDEMWERWDAIFSDLYDIVVAIFDLIVEWVDAKFTALRTDFDEALAYLTDVWQVLWDNVYSKVYEIGADIVQAVSDFLTDAWDSIFNKQAEFETVGGGLMQGIIDGILNMSGAAIEAITGVVEGLINKAKQLLKMESPSKVFAAIGENIGLGLAQGILSMAETVQEAIASLLDVGGALGNLGSGFGGMFGTQTLDPLKAQISAMDALIAEIKASQDRDLALFSENARDKAQAEIDAIHAAAAERAGVVKATSDAEQDAIRAATDARRDAIKREMDDREYALSKEYDDQAYALGKEYDDRRAALKAEITDKEALAAALAALDDEERAAKQALVDAERAAKQALADEEKTRIAEIEAAEVAAIDAVEAREKQHLSEIAAEEAALAAQREEALARQLRALESMMDPMGILKEAEMRRNELMEEYAAQQERVAALEEQRARLQFLQQQVDLLNLIAEHGLDAGSILQGLDLGADADAGALLDAMTRAITEIIAQTEGQLAGADGGEAGLFAQTSALTAALSGAGMPGLNAGPSLSSLSAPVAGGGNVVNLNFGNVQLDSALDMETFVARVSQEVARRIA
jgi:hypothetical protein